MDRPTSVTAFETYGPGHADCDACSLKLACRGERSFVTNVVGPAYEQGGLMVIGEFPTRLEAQRRTGFIGRTAQLLDALLVEAGIAPETVWKTVAVLGHPPSVKSSDLRKHIADDLYACLPRLEAEIAAAKPRVIVVLGQVGLDALTSHAVQRTRLVDNPCSSCDPIDRKLAPAQQCPNGSCKHLLFAPSGTDEAQAAWHAKLIATEPNCPECGTSWKRIKLKRPKCVHCGGKKKTPASYVEYRPMRTLSGRNGVVGAILPTEDLQGDLGELGVRFVIPTYSPALLLMRDGGMRKSKGGKFLMGGQFAARATVDHLRKAKSLLTRDPVFDVNFTTTEHMTPEEAANAIREHTAEPGVYTVDIETNRRGGPWKVTNIVCIGIERVDTGVGLVIDTRTWGGSILPGHPAQDALCAFLESPVHRKVGQNFGYDRVSMLRMWGVEVSGIEGDTMVVHANCYPDEEHGLGFIAHELTDAPAWKGGAEEGAAWDEHAELSGYRTFEELALYNARDLHATALAWTALNGTPNGRGRVDVENVRDVVTSDKVMHEVCIDMEIAGLPLNQQALAKVDADQTREQALHLANMREILKDPNFRLTDTDEQKKQIERDGGKSAAARLQYVLFDPAGPLRLPVLKRTEKTDAPAMDADTLRLHIAEPFVRELLAYKKIEYNLSHFVRAEDLRQIGEDGRFHPTWNVTGARTGRWTSTPNCFSADTEILTERGFVRFDAIDPSEGLRVAQYTRETGGISWVHPEAWIQKQHHGPMLHLQTTATSLVVTPDHRCLVRNRKTGRTRVVEAKDYPEDHEQLHAGMYVGGDYDLPPAYVRFLVAFQAHASAGQVRADGQQVWHFTLDGWRRRRRLAGILALLPYAWTVSPRTTRNVRHVFSVVLPPGFAQSWLTVPERTWTSAWLTEASPSTRDVFIHELHRWGDSSRTGGIGAGMYASSEQANADLVQAVLSISGYRARRRAYPPANPDAKVNWQIDGQLRTSSGTRNTRRTELHDDAGFTVYCVSVPSSFIVVRHNGCVSVTGQCQNWPKWMRAVFVAPPGRKLVGADQAQLEMRIIANLSGDKNLIERCMNAREDDKLNPDCDPHSYVASFVFGATFTSLDRFDKSHTKPQPGEPKCKCQKCKRSTLRDVNKRTIYGLNYGAGGQTVLDAIYNGGYDGPPLTLPFIERVTKTYFRLFPGVPTWRDKTFRDAQANREVRSPLYGRRRIFPLGDVEASVVYNYPIQSGGADVMAFGLARLRKALPLIDPTAVIIAQIHDAVYVECDETKAEAVAKCVEDSLTCEFAFTPGGTPMKYVATAAIGTNLAEL